MCHIVPLILLETWRPDVDDICHNVTLFRHISYLHKLVTPGWGGGVARWGCRGMEREVESWSVQQWGVQLYSWYKQITTPHPALLTILSPPLRTRNKRGLHCCQQFSGLDRDIFIFSLCLTGWSGQTINVVSRLELCATRRESGESRERRRRTGW